MSFVKLTIAVCIIIIGIKMTISIPISEEETNEAKVYQENSTPGEARSDIRKQRGHRLMCIRMDKKGRCLYAARVEDLPPLLDDDSDEEAGSGSGDNVILQLRGGLYCAEQNEKFECLRYCYDSFWSMQVCWNKGHKYFPG
eukprot:Seg2486.1 transcript_id=Seg2486.1/GoldUCD/mRNA.D3Y31 product="hypothetical protein" protein_id=Seg2486.1/GoldUCD/D3Y31